MSDWSLVESPAGVVFTVRVLPSSRRNEIAGVQDRALKVKLTAPPVEGAANTALTEFLAQRLGARRSAVSIVGGEKSRTKTVQVAGMNRAQVERALLEIEGIEPHYFIVVDRERELDMLEVWVEVSDEEIGRASCRERV